ncbi:multiheme c-type cytochrome [Desulfovibrio aminophilus]|uniref:multiheme c-type cytochrome n=1 Tax=Desulfovibrio aminophilus TaxID=81425 RepID=UPI00339374A6
MREMKFLFMSIMAAAILFHCQAEAAGQSSYVGSKTCAQCHEQEHSRFSKYSKKAHSWKSIAVMRKKLTTQELQGCYDCHTTGHGKNGGFVSIEQTPDLADVGCETCHGPGSVHAASGDPKDIRRTPELADCQICHNAERVADFRFKPLIAAGAH